MTDIKKLAEIIETKRREAEKQISELFYPLITGDPENDERVDEIRNKIREINQCQIEEARMFTSEELALAYAEMTLEGLCEFNDEQNRFYFTDKGLEEAFKLWFELPPKKRLTLFLLTKILADTKNNIDSGV